MTKIQIICTSPGMRRNGIAHPASAFYDEDKWTPKQMKAFDADPAFTVREIDETAESVFTDTDFQLAVETEVQKRVMEQVSSLRASFKINVDEVVEEKMSALRSEHDSAIDGLGKQLTAATERATALQAQIDAASTSTGTGKTK